MAADPPPAPTIDRPARRLALAGRALSVRLRFPLIVGFAVLVVAQWDVLRAYWDRLAHGVRGVDLASQAVSGDTEYFCPMDPGVLSDWPSKCPICNMTLVRRKRGDATPLPEGVVARMQFSPYRVQLAGIRTIPATYRPLVREVEGPARVTEVAPEAVHIHATLFPADLEGVAPGLPARVSFDDSGTIEGTVRAISGPDSSEPTVEIEAPKPARALALSQAGRATIAVPISDCEPFRTMPADPPALRPGERRRVYECPDHPDSRAEAAGKCPQDGKPRQRRDLAENQRLRYWCPMHPSVTAEAPGAECVECGGMKLVPRVVTFRPRGEVLAIPADSVIDTGTRQVVYVERMPGMFDGVEVELGPRCGDAFPVIQGLEPGDRVVTAGAFLVDAEGRLNPSLAASYFGAARRETAAAPAPPEDDGLSPADRALVERQAICPVTTKKLGSMGTPVRVEVGSKAVFICCEGCREALEGNPAKYLARLPAKPAP